MKTTRTEMVEKEITTWSCDVGDCDFTTETNTGCCGHSTIMRCDLCDSDCCRDHRESFYENEWDDYPDMTVCGDCLPQAKIAWDRARDEARRYEDIAEVTKRIFVDLHGKRWDNA